MYKRGRKAYLDGLGIKFQALLLVGQELLNILALISLELNHLAHLRVVDDGSIAGELLLDDLENLLLVKLLGQTLDSGQGLASIALCWTDKLVHAVFVFVFAPLCATRSG